MRKTGSPQYSGSYNHNPSNPKKLHNVFLKLSWIEIKNKKENKKRIFIFFLFMRKYSPFSPPFLAYSYPLHSLSTKPFFGKAQILFFHSRTFLPKYFPINTLKTPPPNSASFWRYKALTYPVDQWHTKEVCCFCSLATKAVIVS